MSGFYSKNNDAGGWSRLLDALIPSRKAARKFASDRDRLEAFSRATPLAYCGWDQDNVQAMSPDFPALFGRSDIRRLEDIESALAPSDGAALEGLYDRLQQYGEAFELGARTLKGRTLKIFGRRGVPEAGNQLFAVLSVLDITDIAEGARHAVDAASRAERRETDLRAALNAVPFPIWLRGEDLNIFWCNKSYARAIDGTAATAVAEQRELPLTGANRPDLTQRALSQRAMSKSEPQSIRGHVIIDGARRLVEMTEVPLAAEKRGIGFAIDVTREEEWATAYDRLAASHKESMEQLRTAIAMFDADTKLEFYNAAYEQLTGLSSAWLDSKPKLNEIIDRLREKRKLPEQADYRQFKQQWAQKFVSLIEASEEMQYLPDGTIIRMVVVPRPMGGILVTQEDVTSRLELETSYNTLVAVQQETMNNLAEGIAVFGEDGRLRLFNQSFSRMWDVTEEALGAQPHITAILSRAEKFFPAAEWTDQREVLLANALEREPRRGRLKRMDGTVLEYSSVPLPDGNILNAYFDITDSVLVEQALIEKNAALQAAERLKSDFLANVSYQLRTPLNAIMGFTEMLNHQYIGPLNQKQLEYTQSMMEAGQRLVSLINDILDLSTIEAGYMNLYPIKIPVRALIEQVVDLTQGWALKQKIAMYIECADDLVITADERRLKQVLLNLISNAINYSPGGGSITLSAAPRGDWAVFAVADKGMGIPAGDLSRIFTPFEKINDATTRRRSGAGLGLALVKNIIELHGGDVAIESAEGEGTTVTFRLPLSNIE